MFKEKNVIDEIIEYINKNTKKGYTQDSLRWALSNQGYSRIEIERAFKRIKSQLSSENSVVKATPEIEYKPFPSFEEPKKSFWQKLFGG